MIDLDIEIPRNASPLDCMERLAALNDWSFERDGDDELSLAVEGRWADYQIAITWLEAVEAMHLGCAFDLKVPERRRAEVLQLISMINEQLWIGHFDLWSSENIIMFRHALLLSGGIEPGDEQAAALIATAVEACERYFQAFQFVVWAGKSAKEAIEGALLETAGEA